MVTSLPFIGYCIFSALLVRLEGAAVGLRGKLNRPNRSGFTDLGPGCCSVSHGDQTRLVDEIVGSLVDCKEKCKALPNCGYVVHGWEHGRSQWCTILPDSAKCDIRDMTPTSCGSSGSNGVHSFLYMPAVASSYKPVAFHKVSTDSPSLKALSQPDAMSAHTSSFGLNSVRRHAKCNPTCRWQCTNPECEQKCVPVCDEPQCQVRCKKYDYDACKTECAPNSCAVFCPDKMCASDGCASCQTKCTTPRCTMTCPTKMPDMQCFDVCEKPRCSFSCREPGSCPKPVCKMVCDPSPTCETMHTELPPLSEGEVAFGSFAVPSDVRDMSEMAPFLRTVEPQIASQPQVVPGNLQPQEVEAVSSNSQPQVVSSNCCCCGVITSCCQH